MKLINKKKDTKISYARCPNCNSNNLFITELWQNYIEYSQHNGIIDLVGNLDSDAPFKLKGECQDCEHKWTFRKIKSVDHL